MKHRILPLCAALAVTQSLAACKDAATAARTAARPSAVLATAPACPAHTDFVVFDETSLLSAIASAQPNDTIALNGMIDLTFAPGGLPGVFVQKDNLTFTCATPGSGLRAEPQTVSWLFVLLGRHLTVERLILDATNPVSGAVVAFNGEEPPFSGSAEDIRLVGNNVLCSGPHLEQCVSIRNHLDSLPGVLVIGNTFAADPNQSTVSLGGVYDARVVGNTITGGGGVGGLGDGTEFFGVSRGRFTGNSVECSDVCFFADASPGVVVTGNQLQSAGSSSGIHLQDGTDGDSVVGNTIVATAPSFVAGLGGIRVRDGANAVVTENVVSGPWANSIAVTDLTGADIERNSVQGAGRFGIGLATGGSFIPVSMTRNLFRGNRATGSGLAGISARLACSNTFVGNDLQGNAGDVGLVLNETTGANTFVGNATLVVDNGAFDCNGDGVNDPNIISGPGMAQHGLRVGTDVSGTDPQRTVHGIVVK